MKLTMKVINKFLIGLLGVLIYSSASRGNLLGHHYHHRSEARIVEFIDGHTALAKTSDSDWSLGDIVAVQSQFLKEEIVGFVEIRSMKNQEDGSFLLKLDLIKHSRFHFIQSGDRVISLDLTDFDPDYRGTTELVVRRRNENTSSRYKPLFLLGTGIGETAQNLWENEVLISGYGLVAYGWKDRLTLGTFLPGDLLSAPNASMKANVYSSDANTASMGLLYVKIPEQTKSTLNYNFFWDSISSEDVILHTWLSIALFTYDSAAEVTAIRSIGTSTLQTGYEFILDNWDRVLVGPSFNVEKKSVGGYFSYLFIWNQFHLELSLSSNNITSLRFAPNDGYYPFIDAYWRF